MKIAFDIKYLLFAGREVIPNRVLVYLHPFIDMFIYFKAWLICMFDALSNYFLSVGCCISNFWDLHILSFWQHILTSH